jgi:4-hydroxythreonine-4-phosphate dehydrogenase
METRPLPSDKRPILGITMGDPSGIGPEVVLRALASRRAKVARFVLLGSGGVLRRVAVELKLRFPRFREVAPDDPFAGPGPFLIECAECPPRLALLGRPTARGGRAAAAFIQAAVQLAIQGRIDGIVTAPISKEALHKAGFAFPGHTEMIAQAVGVRRPVMMMAADDLRVALVTTHAAVRDLPSLITTRAVLETVRITHHDLKARFGIARPRLAACALNPHAGEGGLFGDEERRAIQPALRRARAEGIACDGPFAADALFTPERRRRYDAIVAMYHDQACIPVKMLGFDRGVNVTLGLPIIRSSPDHGTAYDIVRDGKADPGSLIAAIRLAAEMAVRATRPGARP